MRESGKIPGSFAISWEQRKVGELIKDGIIDAPLDGNHGEKHPTASEYVDSGIPFLMASDVHGGIADIKSCKFITRESAERLDKGFAKNGDVLLTHKATIGESAILQGLETEYAVLTPQVTYYRIQDEKKLSREYLYAFFNSVKFQNDLKTKAAQSTRPYIGISAQQNLDIVLPRKLTEQKKIGVYFSDLDHLITLHQRKLRVLCILERLLYENIKQFEVTVSWEQRKLSEIADKVTEKNSGLQYVETFTNSAEFGIISQRDFFDHDIAKLSSLDGYYIVKNEDFVYNPRISTSAPVGPINRNKLGRTGVMSPLYTVFRPHDIDTTYLEYFFKCGYWHSFMNFNGDSGARSDRFSIKDNVFFQMPIPIPHLDEQRKIGKLLTRLDNLITLHQRKP